MKLFLNWFVSLLLLVSTQTYALVSTYSIDIADEPIGFIVSKNDSYAYVTTGRCELQSSGEVDVIDLKFFKVIGKIKVPGCLSSNLFLTKDEKTLYINYDKTIAMINLDTLKIVQKIDLQKDDYLDGSALMSPDKSKIYYHIWSLWDPTDYSHYFLVLNTKTNEITDKIPNTKAVCAEGCFPIDNSIMSPNGNYIYEMPDPEYLKPQRLLSLNVHDKHVILLGIFNTHSVFDSLFLTKDGKTFYNTVYETDDSTHTHPSDWYIHVIDKDTMKLKELYHTEHEIRAIGLFEEKHQLYILHLRNGQKRITIIDTMTGNTINNIAMPNTIITAKVTSNPNLSDIYFTTMPGNGNGSLFNIMKFK